MVTRLAVFGLLEVNCYLYADENSGHAFLIDPGAQGPQLAAWLGKQGLKVEKILITHGHFDHIGGLDFLSREKGLPVWIHEAGDAYLKDPELNLSARFHQSVTFGGAHCFRDGAVFALEASPDFALRVIHTPGHTPDSVLFYDEKRALAFTGDTIFQGSRGNDAFPGGDGAQLLKSIREKVLPLPEETVLYPGHGEPTTVGDEKYFYL